jgi:hypothetical protein
VGLLALAPPSEAKIIYTHAHHVIRTNGSYALDLNHDRTTDFLIRELGSTSGTWGTNFLLAKEARGNAVQSYNSRSFGRVAAGLKKGARIGRSQGFISGNRNGEVMEEVRQTDGFGVNYYGQWMKVTDRYLGLRFKIHGKIHYGWARLSVREQGRFITATVTGYAYETTPNKSIIAGKTHGSTDDPILSADTTSPADPQTNHIPDTSQLASPGMLALGAQGVPLWRRKESAETQ